jgi:small-conductance mechanosensitive channel
MKLSLRLTYDTDAEKVRKLIKKLGQEMAEEPNLKPLFLQPLKSQGVIEMQDSAQIMRVKFMTRPGDQWGLRRVVFARIRDLFEKEGIRFASREVVVRIADHQGERELTEAEQEAVAAAAARVTEPEPEVESAPKSEPALTPAHG